MNLVRVALCLELTLLGRPDSPENGDQPGLDKPDAWLEGPMILMQPNEWGSKRIVIDEKRVCTTSLNVSVQLAIHPRAKAM